MYFFLQHTLKDLKEIVQVISKSAIEDVQKILGSYCSGDHLFPSRTEKLSPLAQMVLEWNLEEYVAAPFYKVPFI